ncbi:MAG: glycosyltransferase [Proteobacteria bacterium]|nr:glycosyltransferase [Pseudomonadota bacterium]
MQFISLRHPTDKARHPIHNEITAPVSYLPEYLYQEPLRVLKAWWSVRKREGYRVARKIWLKDLRRDLTPNRVRRFGQALVLAEELPDEIGSLYAHFLHTPASVTRYAAIIRDLPWSCSAHAKDIWTSPEWELKEKLQDIDWLVTCTSFNAAYLKKLAADPDKIELMYHGLDLSRFPKLSSRDHSRDGSDTSDPVKIVSVGRAVKKKGYDDLLHALVDLPPELNWQFTHIGGGPLLEKLRELADTLGISDRIEWLGAQPQQQVIETLRSSDVFVLASRIAEDGDRDGLPNVLMEAQSQKVAVLSTNVSAIPELIVDGKTGLLVEERDPAALATALQALCQSPEMRTSLSDAGDDYLRNKFDSTIVNQSLLTKLGVHSPASTSVA